MKTSTMVVLGLLLVGGAFMLFGKKVIPKSPREKSQEELIKKYEKKMAARYGEDWREQAEKGLISIPGPPILK